ncbi:MAG: hypothetical protein EOP11_03055 [Proteobacteria bacterium]|nr:MAG: hypothetical protein EOP11_03055 [Pseudomonadota bacterium]
MISAVKQFNFFLSLLLCLTVMAFTAPSAEARPRKKKEPVRSEFSVEVPVSEVDVVAQAKRDEEKGNVAYELSISTWSPSNFTRPSFQPDVLKFKNGGIPLVGIARIAPLKISEDGSGFHWRAGLNFVNLERQGLSQIGPVEYASSQTLNLISLSLGIEYRGPELWQVAQPYANFSLLPTYLLGPRSPFEEPVNEWGLPMELGAGLLARPAFLEGIFGLGDGAVGLGAHYMFGSIDASSLSGFGGRAFLQIVL